MRRVVILAALALAACVSAAPPLHAQQPKPDDKTVSLKIYNRSSVTSMVELYQDGKLLRSREIDSSASHIWPNLKPGRYEVHFLNRDNKPLIKRVLLSEDDVEQSLNVELATGNQTRVIGGGVSLHELAEAIEKVKKENAEIRAEIEKLKKK